MKKALGILLVVCLLMGTGLAETDDTVGSGVDLTVLTDEQVRKLQQEVKETLAARGLGVVMQTGIYVVGTDISAGSYVFSAIDPSDWLPTVYAYANSQKFEEEEPAAGDWWVDGVHPNASRRGNDFRSIKSAVHCGKIGNALF